MSLYRKVKVQVERVRRTTLEVYVKVYDAEGNFDQDHLEQVVQNEAGKSNFEYQEEETEVRVEPTGAAVLVSDDNGPGEGNPSGAYVNEQYEVVWHG